MGLKPVLPSWSKWHWLRILSSSYAVGYWHRHTPIIFPCCFNQLSGPALLTLHSHKHTRTCQLHANIRPDTPGADFIYFSCCCGQFRSLSLSLLSLCHCQGQRNHEIAQGSQWSTLFSVTHRKSFVITRLKSYPVKIESNISSPHPVFQRQSSCLLFHIFSSPLPPPSLKSPPLPLSSLILSLHSLLLPALFYLPSNLVHDLIFWCNYLKNDSRAGLHLKAI